MTQQSSPSQNLPYSISRVCRVWKVPRSSFYQSKKDTPVITNRRGPKTPCDRELTHEIRLLLSNMKFHGEGHRKLWLRLRQSGIRTSKRRLLRLMRQDGLLAHQRIGNAHGPKAHDGKIVTPWPNIMWGTDMTTTTTVKEGNVAVFIAIDHCTAQCVGIHAAPRGTRFHALEPIRQAVREQFGEVSWQSAKGLSLRHDHGSAYMSTDFQNELQFLGIVSSPSYVREPQGNGCAERFIRTLKENLLWQQTYHTVQQLLEALLDFKQAYNSQWLIARHGYKTPIEHKTILESKRQEIAA